MGAFTYITLRYFHGGVLNSKSQKPEYEGGEVTNIFDVDVDKLSYFELASFLKELGYATTRCTFYLRPPKKDFLLSFQCDEDIFELSQSFKNEDIVEVYVCMVDKLDQIDGPTGLLEHTTTNEESFLTFNKEGDKGADKGDRIAVKRVEGDHCNEAPTTVAYIHLENEAAPSEASSAGVVAIGGEAVADDVEFKSDVHEDDINLRAERKKYQKRKRREKIPNDSTKVPIGEVGTSLEFEEIEIADKSLKGKVARDEPMCYSSDEYSVESDLEDGLGRTDSRKLVYDNSAKQVVWQLDMVFKDVNEFRDVVTKYALQRGVKLEKYINESKKVRVKCKERCPWLLYASINKSTNDFRIKTYNPEHRKAFLGGCRRYIGLDGCFLKGVTKEQLLVVVAKDDNNQCCLLLGLYYRCVQDTSLPTGEKWRGLKRRNQLWKYARSIFEAEMKKNLNQLAMLSGEDIVPDLLHYKDSVGSSIVNVGPSDVQSTSRPRGRPRNTPPTTTTGAPLRPRERPRKTSDNPDAPPRPRERPGKTTPAAPDRQVAPAANVEHVAATARGRGIGRGVEHAAAGRPRKTPLGDVGVAKRTPFHELFENPTSYALPNSPASPVYTPPNPPALHVHLHKIHMLQLPELPSSGILYTSSAHPIRFAYITGDFGYKSKIGGASEAVEAVHFSFMTDEEVRRHSIVKVTSPNLLDTIGNPVPNGLYDPAMGPLDERSPCKSCGQRNCSGHCGHIELVSPVYNPLLFNMLHNLLQRTCFYCFHFRASRAEVEKCVSELELIAKGDVVGAKTMDALSPDESSDREESEGSHMSCTMDDLNRQDQCEYNKRPSWDNFQFIEAMAVIDRILKTKSGKCSNCDAKNPKITKPSFGRFHMDMSSKQIRDNSIKSGRRFNLHYTGGSEENPSPEVVNVTEPSVEDETSLFVTSSDGLENPKARGKQGVDQSDVIEKQQKDSFSVAHLPSQSQHRNTPGKVAGPSMFFLESILVPPVKFRPPAKAGQPYPFASTQNKGSIKVTHEGQPYPFVMEHPHTVLLGKVIQSNIALGNAHINRVGRSKIISRLMDLQQSVNVLFDSKTASGEFIPLFCVGCAAFKQCYYK
ncbi:hypothetical protein FXO37_06842 [Capsicum annuum]|nr:hypothetical protein FXO37_06842 [Capsicum annuum]